MASDRIFGLVVIMVARAYIASALQIQASFLSDPVGPKLFPIIVGVVSILSGLVMILRPDESPEWPKGKTLLNLAIALGALVAYAYALKPMGFLLPTAVVAAILSYQIEPRKIPSVLTGLGLSVGLYIMFKYGLGLGLVALPKSLVG
jgi:putative tricarboxylic transport membrane protein